MEKKYSEAFSQLVAIKPEALGVPVFSIRFNLTSMAEAIEQTLRRMERHGGASYIEWALAFGGDYVPSFSFTARDGEYVSGFDLLPSRFVVIHHFHGTVRSRHGTTDDGTPWVSYFDTLSTGGDWPSDRSILITSVPADAPTQNMQRLYTLRKGCGRLGEEDDDYITTVLLLIQGAYVSGGELVEAKPTLSRAASALKRKPVYKLSYTTVQLPGVKSERKAHQGGTHASPRRHERRGHWRTYRSGKRVWVKNCVVGDPSLGHVKHAYVVTQGETS